MISFKIRAPGKVILFGEHAVVYGKTALATSLGRQTFATFTELPADAPNILVEMPKVQAVKKIDVKTVQEGLFKPEFPNLETDGHEKFVLAINEFVGRKIDYTSVLQRASMECFFYAMVQVAQKHGITLKPFKLILDTELPVGAGVGSSASFAVCLAATFLRWSQLQKDLQAPPIFDSACLEKISTYALNCEKIMHGQPSGIDNSICTFGTIIEFRKGEDPKFMTLKNMRILLVDTKIDRSTKIILGRLGALKQRYPEIYNPVMDAIDGLCKRVMKIIRSTQDLQDDDEGKEKLLTAYQELAVLVDLNQKLLRTCHVSHSTLDQICATAEKYDFAAKLTGAGGGGFAYVLIPPNADGEKVRSLSSELTVNGFSVIETELGGPGVRIHDA